MSHPEERPPFRTDVEIGAAPDLVWRALTDADHITRWFAPAARIDARVGGELVWDWPGHHAWRHEIVRYEPGVQLTTRYDQAHGDPAATERPLFVDFRIEGRQGHTILRLTHSGFGTDASFDQEYDGISCGWPVELRSLRLYLEDHRGEPRHAAWTSFVPQLDPAGLWRELAAPGRLGAERLADLEIGDRLSLDVGHGAGRLSGTVYARNRFSVAATVEDLDQGMLHFWVGDTGDHAMCWMWLSAWGDRHAPAVARVQRAFDAITAELGTRSPVGGDE